MSDSSNCSDLGWSGEDNAPGLTDTESGGASDSEGESGGSDTSVPGLGGDLLEGDRPTQEGFVKAKETNFRTLREDAVGMSGGERRRGDSHSDDEDEDEDEVKGSYVFFDFRHGRERWPEGVELISANRASELRKEVEEGFAAAERALKAAKEATKEGKDKKDKKKGKDGGQESHE